MLLGQAELDEKANPVGPAAICNRFHLTIRDLPVDTTVLLVVYKLFDKQVMNFAGGLYEELTSLLTHAGFVPKTPTPSRPRSQGAAAKPWRGSSPPAPDHASRDRPPTKDREFDGYSDSQPSPVTGHGPGGYDPLPQGQPPASPHYPLPGYAQADPGHGSGGAYPGTEPGLFHTLQNLLAGYRDSAGYPSTPAPEEVAVVATPELIGVLSELQRVNPAPAGNAPRQNDKPDLRGRLKEVLELERDGPSYSVDSLRELRQQTSAVLVLVLGVDAFNGFAGWKAPDEILGLAHLVVCGRPGFTLDTGLFAEHRVESAQALSQRDAGAILALPIEAMDCSSSQVRAELLRGHTPRQYLPAAVADYIDEHNLYRKPSDTKNTE